MIIQGNFNFIEVFPRLIEVLAIIPITIIFGRFFCGWFCIFGTFNDYIYMISKKIFKTKFRVSTQLDTVLKYIKYAILLFIIAVIWTMGSNLFDTVSPWDAFAQISDFSKAIVQYPAGFMVLALIMLGAVFIERFFCRYLCPLGAVFAIVSKIRIFKIDKPTSGCGKCRICTNNCPMGIELYKTDKVTSGECINCLKCIPVCPRKNTQASICDENVNPALASAVAMTAFAGLYTADNMIGKIIRPNNFTVSTNGNLGYGINKDSQQKKYKDGTYIGVGNGYRPDLKVSVTIKNSKIEDVQIISSNETPRYA
ncbi:4Fe-4S binding protein [Clostridium polyendosporum]|nr:4Fe-4S binding protein [Clostridium polyendosporum]